MHTVEKNTIYVGVRKDIPLQHQMVPPGVAFVSHHQSTFGFMMLCSTVPFGENCE